MKKAVFIIIIIIFSINIYGQEIVTPQERFEQFSAFFGTIKDYKADIRIVWGEGGSVMEGKLQYKAPNMIRIDFTNPSAQVLVSNGNFLRIYVPRYSFVLEQKLSSGMQSLENVQGYNFLKRHYSVAYLVGQAPVALDAENGLREKVIKLKFISTTSAYKEMIISFTSEGLMRRLHATRFSQNVTMDFSNIRINNGIPDEAFDYEAPPNANVYEDFLYKVIE